MTNPYELWTGRKSLGVMREAKVESLNYFRSLFPNTITSDDEYIDFEKLPVRSRKLAPYALPLARGGAVYDDSSRAYRFKPAYVILDDAIDPLKPLSFQPGIDRSRFEMHELTPMQRIELLKVAITTAHIEAWERRLEFMAARAIIDGQITITGPNYPSTLVNFQRDAGHTVVLGSGSRFGESGVSILDFFQSKIDTMLAAEFGGMTTRITMSGAVAAVVRKDEEILAHMDINVSGGRHSVERGMVSGGEDGEQVYKFGELYVGGTSGRTIELWVNDAVYEDDAGTQQRYLAANALVMTSSASRINGFECFGRIVDQDAEYKAIPLFPKNYVTGNDVKVQHISHKSSPIMVPINPNATLKATVLA